VEELVFGTTAAAGFYRRRMLEDISLDGQIFDEQFFVYREDVDLAWRAQLYGWPCGYQPRALAYHVRQGIPERRSLLSATINYHSVKNRFLLRIKNMPWSMYLRHIPVITSRDLLVVAYAVLKEHYSLRAIPFLRKNWKLYLRYRAEIESNRRVPQREIAKWIGWKPRSFPLHSE
jgi:GT2 family glycosyltransferase